MALNQMELQNTVVGALNALYRHPDDAVRSEADHWLQEFQRTIDAWQVADNLLHDANTNMETLIFCSQTLRSKVQRDFEELPSNSFRALQESLYVLLKKFNNGPPKVRTQICIAVAALSMHLSVEDWGAGGVVSWIADEMKSYPQYVRSFLELLTVLPQEIHNYKTAVRPERRRQFEQELTSSAEVALGLLTTCLSFDELKEQVFEAFASWLRLSHGISASTLAVHPLVHAALTGLKSEQLLDASVNVLSELIHYTASRNSGGFAAQMPLIQLLVPHVMGLKDHFKDPEKDEEDVKAIARLFADLGDCYVDLISTGSHEAMSIVQALLDVTSHPDFDISSMTYNFWHHLQVCLSRRDSYGSDASVEAERMRRLQVFHSIFETLVSLVSFRVEYPQDYQELSEEDRREFKHTRYVVSDVLLDATEVLGGEFTLKILFMKLAQAVGNCRDNDNCKWQPVEASLFCIQAIAKSIPISEAEMMPQIMTLLPNLPSQPQLSQTVCATVGAYSKWISAAPAELSILPAVVNILTRGMSISEDCAAAASVAFKYICEDCRKIFSASLDGLFHIYHISLSGEGAYKVSADDAIHLVEALSFVITELPPEHTKKAMELVCKPAISSLQALVKDVECLQQVPARQITVHIDRLACIFRNINLPEVVGDAVQSFWPIFKFIFEQRASDMRTMESLCRACKYAVRTSGRFMGVTIGQMLEEIKVLYQQHNQPCFLYLSSEVIKIFGSDQSVADYLRSLIETLFSHTVKLLVTIKDFTARPDIADDCFLLASRCIRYCPDLFVTSPIFSALVDCSMVGVTVQHREACKSILTFLSDIFDLANSSAGSKYRSTINNVILPRGLTLTRILIASLTGALPSSRLEEVGYVLLSLTRTYGIAVLEWAKQNILLIPSSVITESERLSFLNALSDVAGGSDGSSLTNTLEELSDVCRRNRTVQDIVQDALRPLEMNITAVS